MNATTLVNWSMSGVMKDTSTHRRANFTPARDMVVMNAIRVF